MRLYNHTLLFVVLTLSGCSLIPSVGPTPQVPEISLAARYASTPEAPPSPREVSQWWRKFNDPILDSLIERGIANNKEIKIALSRVRESRALRFKSLTDFAPSLEASGALTRQKLSENAEIAPQGSSPRNLFEAGFDASWEIDIFGGNRRAFEAASAEVAQQTAEYENALITLLAELSRNYIELRGFQKALLIARKNIEIQRESVQIAGIKFNAGLTSELDLAQAKAELSNSEATIPTLEATVQTKLSKIAVLLGVDPSLIDKELSLRNDTNVGTIPQVLTIIPAGIPSELLRERPDIIAAAKNLEGALAHVGVAISDLFPKFIIGGGYGLQSTESATLFNAGSTFWSFVPGVRFPIFHTGSVLANIRVQRERAEQALYAYENTVLKAIEETENALTALEKEKVRYAALSDSFQSSTRALELAQDLYSRGLTDFIRVLDAERTAFAAETKLVESEKQVSLNVVAVYKSLGGKQIEI